jgi:hypothetical protein
VRRARLLLLAARGPARGPAHPTARTAARRFLAALRAARAAAGASAGLARRTGAGLGLGRGARRAADRSLAARSGAGADRAALLDADAMAAPNLDADAAAVAAGAVAPRVPVPIRPAMHQRRAIHGLDRHPQSRGRSRGHGAGAGGAETADGEAGRRGKDDGFAHAFLQKFFNETFPAHQRNARPGRFLILDPQARLIALLARNARGAWSPL